MLTCLRVVHPRHAFVTDRQDCDELTPYAPCGSQDCKFIQLANGSSTTILDDTAHGRISLAQFSDDVSTQNPNAACAEIDPLMLLPCGWSVQPGWAWAGIWT
jgi:hypothetical protein